MRIRPALPQSVAPEQSAAQPTEVSATSAEEPAAVALALAALPPVGLSPVELSPQAPEVSGVLEPASEARAQIPERANQAVASVWLRRVAPVPAARRRAALVSWPEASQLEVRLAPRLQATERSVEADRRRGQDSAEIR